LQISLRAIFKEDIMIKFTVAAALSAAALFASDARAADSLAIPEPYADEAPIIERMRTVCDEYNRCWREHAPRRTVIRQDGGYGYYPPQERYVERRYETDRPPPGVNVYTPHMGVDTDDDDDE
jgi:hypothetical protein